jgi:hypothetical protein
LLQLNNINRFIRNKSKITSQQINPKNPTLSVAAACYLKAGYEGGAEKLDCAPSTPTELDVPLYKNKLISGSADRGRGIVPNTVPWDP